MVWPFRAKEDQASSILAARSKGAWLNGKAPGCKPVVAHARWFDSICSHELEK